MKPTWQQRLNYMSDEALAEALKRREAYIEGKETPIIELNSIETEYRCVQETVIDDDTKEILKEGYYLQYRTYPYRDIDWCDVTDLTELKVWQYNKLVTLLHKHYPEFQIEHLEGRFV